ncbi:membrane translocase subunit Tim21 [Seminavis robusta]|uniref:Mitochondrial import inner membrane translocase subunit Tim21 n=1 Tax=Seminavis robusta TaxID=568900 RepID=A0A9N8D5T8_9STRA|nr:membrane translocase subunit Tim21 [Seminavis robusta]|eukprot:Sro12_g009130.1 membrane translocase subunit Tim21 (276) ;mRNA; r:22830-23890
MFGGASTRRVVQSLGGVGIRSLSSSHASRSRLLVLGSQAFRSSLGGCTGSSSISARQFLVRNQNIAARSLSSNTSGDNEKKADDGKAKDGSEETQIVLTPGQKVVAYSRLTMWGGILAFALCCAYYIGRELFPTKMSPNRVFDKALEVVRNNSEVKRRYGDPIKGYGRDHGGHREGRRNFIEHTERVDPEDGSNRTRVRFNIEGPFGNAFVFAEVSSNMPSGEFVYVLVQDKSNARRVQTVIDNRAALTASRLAGGNKESMAAMSQLLGGGKRSN